MLIGHYIKEKDLLSKNGIIICGVVLLLVVGVYLLWYQPYVDMDSNKYDNYWLFVIFAIVICFVLLAIFSRIKWDNYSTKVLSFLSINAIAFFGYDYSARSLVTLIPGVEGHWLLIFISKIVFLMAFAKLAKVLKINNYLY